MAAWNCVVDLVDEPASDQVLALIDALLAGATDDEIGLVAAGPLEDLVAMTNQGARFIDDLEARARKDPRWASAIAGIWLARDADPAVNRRLADFGARHADGQPPE